MPRHLTAGALALALIAGRAAAQTPACPYRPAPDRRALAAQDLGAMPSVMDNLRALEKADAEIDRAKALADAGRAGEALVRLDAARKLCPGSACARRAAREMSLVTGAATAGVAEQVGGLLKACHLALADGRRAKAADLARQAHAMDPERAGADPLVYKLQLLSERGQAEECEEDGPVSLRPALPGVDPGVVGAFDALLKRGK